MLCVNEKNTNLSVIIPTFNRGHLIRGAIETVLNQTYHDLEIIVVDDGSTDNTEKVVRSFGDERIRYIKLKKNRGAAAARNIGIKAAKGKFIAFQDSDDEWFPEKLEKQMIVFRRASDKVGVVYTAFWRMEKGMQEYIPYSWVKKREGDIHKELLRGNFVTTPAIVLRKECLEKVGMFDERLPRLQDWELVIRVSREFEFKFIREPLLISRFNSDSLTSNNKARIEALKIILEKHLEEFIEEKRILANYYYSIGIYMCLNDEIEGGEDYIRKGFEVNPDKKVLCEKYFIIGRRLWALKKSVFGREYLKKAWMTNPIAIKSLLIILLMIIGQELYTKTVKIFRFFKMCVC